jgi:transposase
VRPAGPKGEQNQAIGISRGGRSTKIHAIVDSKGRPLNFTVTGGQVHDSEVVSDVLDTPKPPLAVTADKAYDSEKVRQQIKDEGALPIIPSRRNATRKAYCPKRFYRRRHKIENYFCRIKDWRRIATRYDKLARNFLAATPALASGRLPPILALEIPLPWRPAATRCRSARADPADEP